MKFLTDLKYLEKLITDSLSYIEEKNNDATLLGGFSGSVIELLGRFMRVHKITDSPNCFGDFLEKYLPKYAPHKNILYRILRCEGAHSVIPQTGVMLTCAEETKIHYLKGYQDVETGLKGLVIYCPVFVKDLQGAVKQFFSDVEKTQFLKTIV